MNAKVSREDAERVLNPARQRLLQLLLERSFKLGHFTLSSGQTSDYYIDCRTATLHPEGSRLIAVLLLPVLAEYNVQQVGGLTLGADPVVATLSLASSGLVLEGGYRFAGPPLPGFIVRKEPKGHGRGRQIEGCFDPGLRTAIIEDVITTGASALKAVDAAVDAGARVVVVAAVVDREEGGREAIMARGLPVRSLFTASELKEAARRIAGDGD